LQSAFPAGPFRATPPPCPRPIPIVTRLNELAREYEARHFPLNRRLDLQGEGPETARERALRWIQTFAHEQPGVDLLLVVERGRHHRKGPVRTAVERLLDELTGGLIEWWQPFAEGSLACRVARDPRRWARTPQSVPDPKDDGRSAETAGAAYLAPERDIPPELLPLAQRAAELRRMREGLPAAATAVVLRGVWNEAQAAAMQHRMGFEAALHEIERAEAEALYEG
jgi:hypothetical protein